MSTQDPLLRLLARFRDEGVEYVLDKQVLLRIKQSLRDE